MLPFLIIYIIFLIAIGIYDAFKVKDFNDYAVAGKKQNTFTVFMSLMASMIGASATIGIMSSVLSVGFPAIYWLGVGTIGLILQSLFLSEKIRDLDASTLPDIARITVDKSAETILALIIAVSWVGIVAAQFVAMSQLISLITGKANSTTLLIIVSLVVVLYTMVGGQLSVVKTDVIQCIIIVVGIIACFIYLITSDAGDSSLVINNIEPLNANYTVKNLVYQLFVVGGTYLLGPDIISRNLVSKDGKTAKKAAMISGIVLIVFAFIIVFIGMWAKYNIPADTLGNANPLIYIITNIIPKLIAIILSIGLISALLSTTDTCLINASSIIEKDILKRDKVLEVRIIVFILGLISIYIAIKKTDIISILTGAYSVYAPGIVFPLLIAILCYKKKNLNKFIWIAAVICGGACGFVATYTPVNFYELPLIGMGISLVLALISVKWNEAYVAPIQNNETTEQSENQ